MSEDADEPCLGVQNITVEPEAEIYLCLEVENTGTSALTDVEVRTRNLRLNLDNFRPTQGRFNRIEPNELMAAVLELPIEEGSPGRPGGHPRPAHRARSHRHPGQLRRHRSRRGVGASRWCGFRWTPTMPCPGSATPSPTAPAAWWPCFSVILIVVGVLLPLPAHNRSHRGGHLVDPPAQAES